MTDTTQHRRWGAVVAPKDDRAPRVRSPNAVIDERRLEAYQGAESLLLTPGKHRRAERLRVGEGGR